MKNINTYHVLTLIVTLSLSFNLQAQGWLKYYNDNATQGLSSMLVTQDDGFLLIGSQETEKVMMIKTDAEGDEEWTQFYDLPGVYYSRVFEKMNGNYLIYAKSTSTTTQIIEINSAGNLIQDYNLPCYCNEIIEATDGNYIAINESFNATIDFEVFKFDTDGNVLWSVILDETKDEKAFDIIQTTDGGFMIAGERREEGMSTGEGMLMKIDENGAQEWTSYVSNMNIIRKIIQTQDGNFVYSGYNITTDSDLLYEKIDPQGNLIWSKIFDDNNEFEQGRHLVETANGDLLFLIEKSSSTYFPIAAMVLKTDADGDEIWSSVVYLGPYDSFLDLVETPDGGTALSGYNFLDTNSPLILVKLDENGVLFSNYIQGNLFYDLNQDCTLNPNENGFNHWLIEASGNHDFYAFSDANGNYSMELDTGNYELKFYPPNNYWEGCQDEYPINFSAFFDTITLDLPIEAVVDCPRLEVEIGNHSLRPCPLPNTISVYYCNEGTIAAEDAYVEVTLDEVMIIDSFSMQPSNVGDNVYTFEVGDLEPFDCGSFLIHFQLECDSVEVGQTLCAEAHIFPDTLCLEPEWEGPIISLDGNCHPDSITFIIENEGGDMDDPQQYIIIEDNIILMQEPFQLLNSETKEITIPVMDNATYFMLAQQAAGIPSGDTYATFAVENCNELPLTSIFNQFDLDDSDPYLDEFCREVTGSYDPNDKQGFPTGFGPDHRIEANTDLDYLIRFQNTGNDTAFKVVLRDEISQFLDITTLRPGASSHPYTLDIVSGRTLKFTFDNILLPDSTTNPEASQGWVQFHIDQMPDNPIGTLIENQAAIYFDGNAPILTNTTEHLIGEDFIQIINNATQVFRPNVELKVYPNPANEYAIFELENVKDLDLTFKLFNAMGQIQMVDNFSDNAYQFYRNGLIAGMYYFQIEQEGKLMVTGKLVLK